MKTLLNLNNSYKDDVDMIYLKEALKKYKATPWKKELPTWDTYETDLESNCNLKFKETGENIKCTTI